MVLFLVNDWMMPVCNVSCIQLSLSCFPLFCNGHRASYFRSIFSCLYLYIFKDTHAAYTVYVHNMYTNKDGTKSRFPLLIFPLLLPPLSSFFFIFPLFYIFFVSFFLLQTSYMVIYIFSFGFLFSFLYLNFIYTHIYLFLFFSTKCFSFKPERISQ